MKWILLGIAVAVTFSLSSCSAPPPKAKPISTTAKPRVTSRLQSEPSARAAAERQKPTVSTTEVPSSKAQVPTTHKTRRRLGGYPGELTHSASTNKIALTLDAGASPIPTPGMLDTLKQAGVHITFFLTGKWCERSPELVKRIAAEGHEICNHTYSHPDLRKLSDDDIAEQLRQTEDLVMNLTGKSTKPYFRPPFGARDKRVLTVAGDEGYTSVYWALDSLDAFKKGITSKEIEDRVLDRVQGGDVVLMHCGSEPTAAALPDIIAKLQQRGFQIVTVSELFSGS